MVDVLFAADRLVPPAGGSELQSLEALAELTRRGHRVRALCSDHGPGDAPDGVQLTRVARATGPERWTWQARRQRAQALGDAVDRALASRPADVVVTQLVAGPAAVDAAARRETPTVVCLHGYEALCHWRFAWRSRCIPETACRGCPRTLALAPHEREARIEIADEHARSLVTATALVSPSAVTAEAARAICGRRPYAFAPVARAPRPVDARPDGPVVAVSSYWTPDKGVALLQPIAERIAPRELHVYAGDDGATAPLPALPANATVHPRAARIEDALSGAALAVCPSQFGEPWSRVAFEAMAAGVPVLASAVGGIPEFVPAAQCVRPHEDPDAWGVAISRVLRPSRWSEARRAGRAAAEAVLADRPLERFVELVERIGSERSAAVAVEDPGEPLDEPWRGEALR